MTAPALSRIHPLGDRALLVQLGDRIDDATLARVRAAAARLAAYAPSAVTDVVPGYASLAVHYDPARVPCAGGELPHRAMARALAVLLGAPGDEAATDGRTVEIPVRYGGEDGPDLDAVARHHDLTVDEVIRRHAAGDYVVHMIGFVPGFPYLGGLDPRLATPRRAEPRTLVPAGSVGIGGAQTGVYPVASPGGWQLIGRTPLALFDARREPPALLRVGDRVRFVPVRA